MSFGINSFFKHLEIEMSDLLERVKKKVEMALEGAEVSLQDDSADHAGHGANGAHLSMIVVYPGFAGVPLLKQHKQIYQILENEMKQEIHALAIKTRSE